MVQTAEKPADTESTLPLNDVATENLNATEIITKAVTDAPISQKRGDTLARRLLLLTLPAILVPLAIVDIVDTKLTEQRLVKESIKGLEESTLVTGETL
ncbi:MAG: hypothetical protein AAGG02_17745, partial [Cyanobacteria bacterium P01_H01_bin.15]